MTGHQLDLDIVAQARAARSTRWWEFRRRHYLTLGLRTLREIRTS